MFIYGIDSFDGGGVGDEAPLNPALHFAPSKKQN